MLVSAICGDGLPALREVLAVARVFYGIPDVRGPERERYFGNRKRSVSLAEVLPT
jgi:hypothetical protein